MKTFTLCGSMRFAKEMQQIAYTLQAEHGYNILPCIPCTADAPPPTPEQQKTLARAHLRKIELSDGIYVVNINGYLGEAVQNEIAYAKALDKEILYHCI